MLNSLPYVTKTAVSWNFRKTCLQDTTYMDSQTARDEKWWKKKKEGKSKVAQASAYRDNHYSPYTYTYMNREKGNTNKQTKLPGFTLRLFVSPKKKGKRSLYHVKRSAPETHRDLKDSSHFYFTFFFLPVQKSEKSLTVSLECSRFLLEIRSVGKNGWVSGGDSTRYPGITQYGHSYHKICLFQ